jgi:tetratricopeptide (TPR) repeat protein
MSLFKANRWVLATALLTSSFGIPRALPAQPQNQAPAPAAAPSATPATATPAQTTPALPPPTPEQLGDALVGHQRYQAAIAAYAKEPQKTATIWNKMGIAYQMMFNSKDATRCYKESLKLDPRNPDVLNNLGTVYASLKEYGQADRLYRKALKLEPRSAVILKNLGTNLLTQHKYNKGWEAYQQALAIDPEIFADHSSPTVENPSNVQERGAMNYYMAAGCARAGHTDCALQYLRLALDEGFTTRKKVASDAEFASLRNNPDFQQLIAEKRSQ